MGTVFWWLIIGSIALLIDIITSAFLFVWITIGAIAAIVAKILGCSLLTQSIIFIAVSSILMLVGYPIVKRTIKSSVEPTPTREQTYLGKEIIIDEDIVSTGSIKIDGVYWIAQNEGGMVKKGDKAKVIGIDGNKIIIKKI
ncbi:NfeD family protein [Clostridium sp. PL3]|uniref:NfeD family protein n=1 Tax=Clostridium thailandense TaxID=2794346 RepID=A0A949TTJ1_9CLOT|nr:NfeD family protein [Clostridium thailandense]MBV7275082.1 NfeD family protein [Clostridium thailandense]